MTTAERQLHFNAFLMSSGHHEAAWRLPESDPFANFDLGHWRNLAQIAERGTFDSLFLADGPALWHSPAHRPAGALEPTVLRTALAMATTHIGLIATASTTYNEPYNLARRFASLDHLSGGRAGWNIVTTAEASSAQNFGLDDRPSHRERYQRAAEFVDVSARLWDSWEDDAELGDKAAGLYADVSRIHPVDYEGEYFRVRGPLNLPRCPQGRPLLVQAGSSPDGREFAARYAEAVFTAQQTLAEGQEFYADMKQRARRLGRSPEEIMILPGIVPVIGSTEAEARAGTPEQVADTIGEWFELGAADGFNVMPAALPSGLEAFTEHVIPIFRQRGLFRTEYTGTTLREHYGIPRPESQFAARREPASVS